MSVQEFKKILEGTEDKLNVFSDKHELNRQELRIPEILDAIREYLSDEEKFKLFEFPHFQKLDYSFRTRIVNLITDTNIKMQVLNNEKIINGFDNYEILKMIKSLDDEEKFKLFEFPYFQKLDYSFRTRIVNLITDTNIKMQVLNNEKIINGFDNYEILKMIKSLNDEQKAEVLTNQELVNKLQLKNYHIAGIAKGISSEKCKDKIIEESSLDEMYSAEIIETYSDKTKLKIILEDKKLKSQSDIKKVIASMNTEALVEFLNTNKEFYEEKEIKPYEIIASLDIEKQKELIEKIEDTGLSIEEKRKIYAILEPETKQSIDIKKLPEEYRTAIAMHSKYSRITLDLEKNPQDYEGLDEIVNVVFPENFTEEEREKFSKICDICPNIHIEHSAMRGFSSNAAEYKKSEEWVQSVIDSLAPNWSDAQKVIAIDNKIGKSISYSADFGTEIGNPQDWRALWRIIDSGYGVCNGIALVEKYIFDRLGIESQLVSSGGHSFLKLKNIELPSADGSTIKGNTIIDPTWNLTGHKICARPDNIFKSYEEIRKRDISSDGVDHKCHKNDEELQDATIGIDDNSLRKLCSTLGLVREDRKFKVQDFFDKSELIDEKYKNQPQKNIEEQLKKFAIMYPEIDFTKCQSEIIDILTDILSTKNLSQYDRYAGRVYNKDDEEKTPVAYTYIDLEELGKKFYYAGKNEFIEMSQEEFEKTFECYNNDLKEMQGIRPWQAKTEERPEKKLENSSGGIGQERKDSQETEKEEEEER